MGNEQPPIEEPTRRRLPSWLRVRVPASGWMQQTHSIVRGERLHTVCEEAACPNLGECWSQRHATFLLLGNVCTRACAFCNVKTGRGEPVDPREPERVAQAATKLGLRHAVVTSVDRDDLPDGGADQFVRTIHALRKLTPSTTIEVLTPDFRRKEGALEAVIGARPDVFNHNLETVPRLYRTVRKGADYAHSLSILARAKQIDPRSFTKSGIMVGLGETAGEVCAVMDDLRDARVDFLTIGQYLRPTPEHIAVERYVEPAEFAEFAAIAREKGFLLVSSSPLTRSSYHADEDFQMLREARAREVEHGRSIQ